MRHFLTYLSLFLLVFTLGCSNSEDADVNNPNNPDPEAGIPNDPERVDYDLSTVNNSGVTGVASFIPNEDGSTTIYIKLENASQGIHPATVNFGTLEEGGAIAITLNECECEVSETVVTQLNNGTAISFVEMMTFDGHLNVYESPTDGTVIAQANIGANAF
jgi:hypothetical protein